MHEPLAQLPLHHEPGLLGNPTRGVIADLGTPLDELQSLRLKGPPAYRPHCLRRHATTARRRGSPVANLRSTIPAQAEPDAGEPLAVLLDHELDALRIPDGEVLHEVLRMLDQVRRGHADVLLQHWILRHLVHPRDVRRREWPQQQAARVDHENAAATVVSSMPRSSIAL